MHDRDVRTKHLVALATEYICQHIANQIQIVRIAVLQIMGNLLTFAAQRGGGG